MSAKINSKYVENYASEFSKEICDQYFSQKKYMTGHQIITLSPSPQVNFFIIKTIFEAWQLELEKLKSNPFFDYRDKTVHEALKEFMNVLSRTIKIERTHFEPLLIRAVLDSFELAIDPVSYYSGEFDKVPSNQINQYLKENKKYYKWHANLITNLIDKAGLEHSNQAYKDSLSNNFSNQKASLEDFKILLNSMGQVKFLDFDQILIQEESVKGQESIIESKVQIEKPKEPDTEIHEDEKNHHQQENFENFQESDDEILIEKETKTRHGNAANAAQAIDPLQAWARFETEEYSIMKGTIKELSESIGLNQRFMFTKELFDGNPDLLKHGLKSIDQCDSFIEAINLINERFVGTLNWDKNSEVVIEFLQLVFRKFDQKD